MGRLTTNGLSNIELLIEETLQSKKISFEAIEGYTAKLPEAEDRIQYLNALLSFEGMNLKYREQFESDVPEKITGLIDQTVDQLRQESSTDSLTKVANRKDFDKRNLRKPTGKYVVLMMDLDKFKTWNDTYGHSVGDIALKALGHILRDSIRRDEGYIARYGGEEFYVELEQTDVSQEKGVMVAERVRTNVEKYGMDLVKKEIYKEFGNRKKDADSILGKMAKEGQNMTISIGLAEGKLERPREETRKEADIALYNAKEDGRNRVVAYQKGMAMPKRG